MTMNAMPHSTLTPPADLGWPRVYEEEAVAEGRSAWHPATPDEIRDDDEERLLRAQFLDMAAQSLHKRYRRVCWDKGLDPHGDQYPLFVQRLEAEVLAVQGHPMVYAEETGTKTIIRAEDVLILDEDQQVRAQDATDVQWRQWLTYRVVSDNYTKSPSTATLYPLYTISLNIDGLGLE